MVARRPERLPSAPRAGPAAPTRRRAARPRLVRALAALACVAASPVALAEGLQLSASLMSDAIWRGYSKSQGQASLALDLTWRHPRGWFAAAGLLDRRAGAATGRWEWTLALGHQWSLDGLHGALADWALSASVLRYEHTGGPQRIDAAYTDFTLAADWQGRAHLLLTLSPDTRLGTRRGWNATWELAWHQRLVGALAFDAGLGWQDNQGIGSPSYGYGSAGLSWARGPLRATLTRIESRAVPSGSLPRSATPSRWVAAIVLTH